MHEFFSKRIPPFTRLLLVESGSRYLFENLLPGLFKVHGSAIRVDLVTCYAGLPKGFPSDSGKVYRVADYSGPENRRRLYRELHANGYTAMGIICSGEPIMTKWKWALAFELPLKVFVLNENGDYFWIDRGHLPAIRHFILFRAGLAGAGAVSTLGRVIVFPFSLLYLLLYAAAVHLRRKVRT